MIEKQNQKTLKNKGYILIEGLIGISLVIIILTILISTFKICDKLFYEKIKLKRNMVDIEESLYFIEYEIMENAIKVEVLDNNIIVYKETINKCENNVIERNKVTKCIKQINNNLIILNKRGWNIPEDTTYKNYIMKNIKKFETEKVDNLLFVTIESVQGDKYERWYSLERNQNQREELY